MAIATRNTLRRITVPAYRSAVTVSRSIPATTEGVVEPRRSSKRENCIISALRYPLVATLLPELFLRGNPTPQLQKSVLGTPPTDTKRQKDTTEKAADKCTNGDMGTLSTTVQQIMTSLQTADPRG
jgi:hypothetical protein